MKKVKSLLIKLPMVRSTYIFFFRARKAFSYFFGLLPNVIIWLFKSKETTNYTYDLEDKNRRYLAAVIADVTSKEFDEILEHINEIGGDLELKRHIRDVTWKSELAHIADNDARFGRRIGWYAFVRARKPKVVVETGVDKGLGACVLTAALKKNRQEGYEGFYFGTDINPGAGYLLSGEYSDFGKILYGDSIETLEGFDKTIDIFINDSDHSPEYEEKEYETIKEKLASDAIILGDNSLVTDKLLKFALETQRHFIFFRERPINHWYPGDGIGIAFKRRGKS